VKIKQCSTVGHLFCGIVSKTRMFCLRKPLKQRQPYRFVALGNETAIVHGHFSGYIYFGGNLEAPNKIIRCAFHTQLSLLRFVLFENSVTRVALLPMALVPSFFFPGHTRCIWGEDFNGDFASPLAGSAVGERRGEFNFQALALHCCLRNDPNCPVNFSA